MTLTHVFVAVVLILFVFAAAASYGPRYATYGWYVSGLGAILIVVTVLHVFFGML